MNEVLHQIGQVAPSSATVLIHGEPGVGKALVARAIHAASARSGHPFVRVHCNGSSEEDLEVALFGRGGVDEALKKSAWEAAGEGTVFLDEIAHLSPALQSRIMGVLQDRAFEQFETGIAVPAHGRLLAATIYPLEQLVQKGAFRHDLFYRLNIFPIQVPSLRDRKGDIPLLVRHFLERSGQDSAQVVRRVFAVLSSVLMHYDWPGNVRELERVTYRALQAARLAERERDTAPSGAIGTNHPAA